MIRSLLMKCFKITSDPLETEKKQSTLESLRGYVGNLECFEAYCAERSLRPIYHVTVDECAIHIMDRQSLYGEDIVHAAHFHMTPRHAEAQARRTGVTLGFSWAGDVRRVDPSDGMGTHSDQEPNILFEAMRAENSSQVWELRIYPESTVNLKLEF